MSFNPKEDLIGKKLIIFTGVGGCKNGLDEQEVVTATVKERKVKKVKWVSSMAGQAPKYKENGFVLESLSRIPFRQLPASIQNQIKTKMNNHSRISYI